MQRPVRPALAEPAWSQLPLAVPAVCGIEVRRATAAHPDCRLGVDFRFPDLFPAIGIHGDHVVMRRTEEDTIANL